MVPLSISSTQPLCKPLCIDMGHHSLLSPSFHITTMGLQIDSTITIWRVCRLHCDTVDWHNYGFERSISRVVDEQLIPMFLLCLLAEEVLESTDLALNLWHPAICTVCKGHSWINHFLSGKFMCNTVSCSKHLLYSSIFPSPLPPPLQPIGNLGWSIGDCRYHQVSIKSSWYSCYRVVFTCLRDSSLGGWDLRMPSYGMLAVNHKYS